MTHAGDRPAVRRDRRLRRGAEVPRHAGQALLERHVRAPGVRRGRAPRDPRSCSSTRSCRSATPTSRSGASRKMHDVADEGRTVLLVSHQMRSVEELCDRVVLLDKGTVAFEGSTAEGVSRYLHQAVEVVDAVHPRSVRGPARSASPRCRCPDRTLPRRSPSASASSWSRHGTASIAAGWRSRCAMTRALPSRTATPTSLEHWFSTSGGPVEGEFTLGGPWLHPGDYVADLFVCNAGVLDAFEGACRFTVRPGYPYRAGVTEEDARRDCCRRTSISPRWVLVGLLGTLRRVRWPMGGTRALRRGCVSPSAPTTCRVSPRSAPDTRRTASPRRWWSRGTTSPCSAPAADRTTPAIAAHARALFVGECSEPSAGRSICAARTSPRFRCCPHRRRRLLVHG